MFAQCFKPSSASPPPPARITHALSSAKLIFYSEVQTQITMFCLSKALLGVPHLKAITGLTFRYKLGVIL